MPRVLDLNFTTIKVSAREALEIWNGLGSTAVVKCNHVRIEVDGDAKPAEIRALKKLVGKTGQVVTK